MATRGLFVVLEGGDGCGKSTQAERSSPGWGTWAGRWWPPGSRGRPRPGAAIRSLVLGGGDLDPRAEALLIAADRAEHVAEVIRPALDRGAVVVSDRYVPSSLAYQGVARGLGVEEVARLSEWATGGLEPDVVVVLDVPGRRAGRPPGGSPGPDGAGAGRLPGRGQPGLPGPGRPLRLDAGGRQAPVDEVAEQVWAASGRWSEVRL